MFQWITASHFLESISEFSDQTNFWYIALCMHSLEYTLCIQFSINLGSWIKRLRHESIDLPSLWTDDRYKFCWSLTQHNWKRSRTFHQLLLISSDEQKITDETSPTPNNEELYTWGTDWHQGANNDEMNMCFSQMCQFN